MPSRCPRSPGGAGASRDGGAVRHEVAQYPGQAQALGPLLYLLRLGKDKGETGKNGTNNEKNGKTRQEKGHTEEKTGQSRENQSKKKRNGISKQEKC